MIKNLVAQEQGVPHHARKPTLPNYCADVFHMFSRRSMSDFVASPIARASFEWIAFLRRSRIFDFPGLQQRADVFSIFSREACPTLWRLSTRSLATSSMFMRAFLGLKRGGDESCAESYKQAQVKKLLMLLIIYVLRILLGFRLLQY